MNPNIEVITPKLWAVNSEYIKAGWIQELTPVLNTESRKNKYASLTNDGIMILKKESEIYPLLKLLVPKIILHTNKELQSCLQTMKSKDNLGNYEKIYMDVLEWESKRRRIRYEYLNGQAHRLSWRSKIKRLLQKVGEKFGYYKNSD